MNNNRSGKKYNPPANWEPGMPLITVDVAAIVRRVVKKIKAPKKWLTRRERKPTCYTPRKRLHAVKLRGKGDRLTNSQRYHKNKRA